MTHLVMRTNGDTNVSDHGPAAPSAPSSSRLITAPLPELLAEANAEIIDSSICDANFFGAAVQNRNGRISLHLPTGRSDRERDTMVRALVGRLVGADLKPLPASLEVRTYGGAR